MEVRRVGEVTPGQLIAVGESGHALVLAVYTRTRILAWMNNERGFLTRPHSGWRIIVLE